MRCVSLSITDAITLSPPCRFARRVKPTIKLQGATRFPDLSNPSLASQRIHPLRQPARPRKTPGELSSETRRSPQRQSTPRGRNVVGAFLPVPGAVLSARCLKVNVTQIGPEGTEALR